MSTLAVNTVQNLSGASSMTGVGKILQTKIGTLGSDLAGSSTSFADTGLSETITLSSTSNKLYILLSTTPYAGGSSGERFHLQIVVTPSGGADTVVMKDIYYLYRTNDDWKSSSGFHQVLYSPSSTAQLTVKVQYKRDDGGDNLHWWSNTNSPSTNTIVLQEVGA